MKKIILAIMLLVIVVLLLPIFGNSVTKTILNDRVTILTSNGLTLKNDTTQATYFTTKNHYEFSVSDTGRFVKYLNQYSDAQIPPYVDALIDGVNVGIDIEYSNFPFYSKVLVDIYPLSLSTKTMNEFKSSDVNFYAYVKDLLESRGVLYHINYDITAEEFDGYIKDIDEKYDFSNGTKIGFKLQGATYEGQGPLIAPRSLRSNISDINLDVYYAGQSFIFKLNDLSSAFTFQSRSTYASSASIKSFSILIDENKSGKTNFDIDEMKMNLSSNTQGKSAEFYIKSSIGKLKVKSKGSNIIASDFNYDISIDGVDKDSYEEFRELTSSANVSTNYSLSFEKKLQEAVTNILSKGFVITIADLSIAKIGLENKKPIDAFSMMIKIVLKEDASLAKKLKSSPMTFVNNINLDSTIKLSKDFYTLINREAPLTAIANPYSIIDGDKIIFKIKLEDGRVIVNNKVIN